MPTTIEERVAYLEGKVEEHSKNQDDVKTLIIGLDQKLDRRIDALDLKLDSRIDALDQRINRLDQRIDHLDQKFSKYFLWIIGIQVTILLSIIATLLK
jgi:chromosome segregation ATPase